MKKTILLAAALTAAMTLSACGGGDGGSAYAGNYYAETTTKASKEIVSEKTIVLGDLVGSYSGEMKDGLVDGEGTWICQNWTGCPGAVVQIDGVWSQGYIWNGIFEVFYNGSSLGKANILDGELNEDEVAVIDANYSNALSQEEWNDTVEGIKEIGGYIGDFINWYDSVS